MKYDFKFLNFVTYTLNTIINKKLFKMKKINLLVLLAVLFAVMMTIGCSKDDDNNAEPQTEELTYTTPSLSEKSAIIEVPSALKENSNTYAQQCVGYIDMVNGLKSYFSSFDLPADAVKVDSKGDGVTYTWSASDQGYNVQVWVTYKEVGSKYTWDYEIEFDDVPRSLYMHAEQDKDGNNGMIQIYDIYDLGFTYVLNWNTNSDGVVTMTCEMGYETMDDMVLTVVVNPDGSGDVTYKSGGELFYEMNWNADGSGSMTSYVGGTTYTETWT